MNDAGGGQRRAPRKSDADIEAQIRAIYGARFEACERFHAFGEDALYAWPDERSTQTRWTPSCSRRGRGPRRPTAGCCASWRAALARRPRCSTGRSSRAWPSRTGLTLIQLSAIELFKKHGRHSELLWGDAFEKAEAADAREIDAATEEERKELGGLFGKYGTIFWTAHRSLYDLLPEIEEQWPDGEPRDMLWWFFRIAHRDNNQVLHSTALGLSGGVTRTSEDVLLDAGPSDRYLDRAMLGGWWCYEQTLTLLWDHFQIPGREALDEIAKSAGSVLERPA